MTRPRTVLVAGAGIGGLAASIALANAGFRTLVFERDPVPDQRVTARIAPSVNTGEATVLTRAKNFWTSFNGALAT